MAASARAAMTDLARYSRQIVLREVGVNGQAVLRDSSVLIVGLGGLGSPAALYLAAAGVGRLVLCDRDRVDLSNLQRQILYARADLGHAKTAAARERLAALNPDCELLACAADEWESHLALADVVLDCTDNFPTRYAVNAACVRARKPLVSGAAIRFECQLAVFDLRSGGPCYACLYPDAGAAQESCEEAGILGPVAGAIGAMQALAALKLLLGQDAPAGRLWRWDAARMDWRSLKIQPDPQCPVCGRAKATGEAHGG
jgi:molybdopterin/thiamine biosynthesis adenylyltransferase